MDKGMKILELYGELAKFLQDEELVKNLKELYKKHPEKFDNFKKVSDFIKVFDTQNKR
ncbi:hypothetical protein [Helicobacter colisuis]|uniref:hypothetical protein n=1 Tax=Helicobacter colisuis TaxID=2949739 RepID=UPI00202A1809|nr:hypothetical protein [Helicobacter colisuis]MCL9822860.1 hypothetical protein [Helicobacter colisuis]